MILKDVIISRKNTHDKSVLGYGAVIHLLDSKLQSVHLMTL